MSLASLEGLASEVKLIGVATKDSKGGYKVFITIITIIILTVFIFTIMMLFSSFWVRNCWVCYVFAVVTVRIS